MKAFAFSAVLPICTSPSAQLQLRGRVDVELDAVALGVSEGKCLADGVVGAALAGPGCLTADLTPDHGEGRLVGMQDRRVVQTRAAL